MNILPAFDVGGTYIKAAVLDDNGRVIPETAQTYQANADADRETLIAHFYGILVRQLRLVKAAACIKGIGYSFPGPFDYEQGICLLRGQGKYDALYGVCLRNELQSLIRLQGLPISYASDMPILFENDGALFALGEWMSEHLAQERRISITLGTGTGSAFLENGHIVKHGLGVPQNGWIYNLPCRGATVDDWLSARGLVRLAAENGLTIQEPVSLFEMAQSGDQKAKEVFLCFGRLIGETLRPIADGYRANRLVVGGQIAKSGAYFLPEVQHCLPNVMCSLSRATSESVYMGIDRQYQIQQQEREST